MNLSQVTTGMLLTFTPASANISTLTVGNTYIVKEIRGNYLRIDDDSGRERGYLPTHFTPAESSSSTPSNIASIVDLFDRDVEPDSPERVYTLSDGSLVNPTGMIKTNQAIAEISEGTEFEVAEIRFGVDSQELAIGIMYQPRGHSEEKLFFIPAEYFCDGEVSGVEGLGSSTITRDVNNRRLNVEGKVLLLSAITGVNAGSLGQVVEVLEDNEVVINFDGVSGNKTLTGAQLRHLTASDYQARVQRNQALSQQTTVDVQVGERSFTVMSSSLDAISETVRRFAV